jgi:Leucine-rich repeat (LRR) protein
MSEKEFFSSVLELKRLKKLKATFQTIKGVPPSFEGLKNLEELFFDVCTTTEKDFENLLRNLPNLEVMILAGLKGSSLPKTIKYLTNLKHLEIQYSEIDTLPKEVNKLKSLTYLNIAHSKIIGIPKAVYKLKNLERFVVSSKKISAQDEETLKKKLPNCEIIVIDW